MTRSRQPVKVSTPSDLPLCPTNNPGLYPLSFHSLPHSLAQWSTRNRFPLNHLRTLSHSTEGGVDRPMPRSPVSYIFFQVPYALSLVFSHSSKKCQGVWGLFPLRESCSHATLVTDHGPHDPFNRRWRVDPERAKISPPTAHNVVRGV